MKPSELRVGNYVRTSYYYDTEEAKDDLGADYSEDKEWIIDTVQGICHPNDEFLYWGELELEDGTNRTEGIPLTEQWFIDFGMEMPINEDPIFEYGKGKYKNCFNDFKKTSQSLIDASFEINGLKFWADSNGFWFNIMMDYTKIEYVHQLQNLYFALTGKELEKRLKDWVNNKEK